MKNAIVLRNRNSMNRHHACGPEILEAYINELPLAFGQYLHKWEGHMSKQMAGVIKLFTILSGDKKLALLLWGIVTCACILTILVITLASRLI
jgi:hypothetical protein